jgi:hypothetical protein
MRLGFVVQNCRRRGLSLTSWREVGKADRHLFTLMVSCILGVLGMSGNLFPRGIDVSIIRMLPTCYAPVLVSCERY